MRSQTFKELEQQADGVMEPHDPGEPIFVVEFQAQRNKRIYQRLVIEIASYGKTYPAKKVLGILIFTKGTLNTKTQPWHF